MIIESVELKNWKCINRLSLSLGPGVNIIYGPNEIGKSTLLQAIKTGILEDAQKNNQQLKALVPWKRKVKPFISITVKSGKGDRYRIEKSFPKGEAKLFFTEGKNDRLVAEGKEVNPFFKTQFGFDESLEGLFNLLWIEQGKALNLFESNKKSIVGKELKTRIQEIIKEQLISPIAEEFYESLVKEYYDYFKPSGGGYKTAQGSKGKIVADSEAHKTQLEQDISKTTADIHEYEEKVARLSSYEKAITESTETIERLEGYIEKLKGKKRYYDEVQKLSLEFNPMLERYRELQAIEQEIARVTSSLPVAYSRKRDLARKKVTEISKKLDGYAGSRNKLKAAEKELKNSKPIDQKTVERAVRLEQTLREIELTLGQSEINVAVDPDNPAKPPELEITIDNEQSKEVSVTESHRFKASRSASLHVPDNFTVSITGPLSSGQFEEAEEKRKSVRSELSSLLGKYKAGNAQELRDHLTRYYELRSRQEQYKNQVQAIDRESLEEDKAALENFLASNKELNKDAGTTSPAETQNGAMNEEQNKAAKLNSLEELDRFISKLESSDEYNRKRRDSLLKEKTFEEYEQEVTAFGQKLKEKKAKLKTLEPVDIDEIPDTLITEQEKKLATEQKKASRLKEERAQLTGELTHQEDLPAKKNMLEHDLTEVENQLRAEYVTISTLETLIRLTQQEKKRIEQNIVAPVQDRISKSFEKITSGRYPKVTVNNEFADFRVEGKAFDGTPVSITPDILSTGTQEQLSFLFRFVLAEQLSKNETHIMALDDSFVNSDRERMEDLISMMRESQDRIQFLVFTCNEEDYTRFGEIGRFIDLRDVIV